VRRRAHPLPRVGVLVPFVAPEGDYRAVWHAYEAWDAAVNEWLTAHPQDADAVAEIRSLTRVPAEPWDPYTNPP